MGTQTGWLRHCLAQNKCSTQFSWHTCFPAPRPRMGLSQVSICKVPSPKEPFLNPPRFCSQSIRGFPLLLVESLITCPSGPQQTSSLRGSPHRVPKGPPGAREALESTQMLFLPFLSSSSFFFNLLAVFWFCFLSLRLHPAACGLLVPQPGVEPVSPAVEAWSLNLGTQPPGRSLKDYFSNH